MISRILHLIDLLITYLFGLVRQSTKSTIISVFHGGMLTFNFVATRKTHFGRVEENGGKLQPISVTEM